MGYQHRENGGPEGPYPDERGNDPIQLHWLQVKASRVHAPPALADVFFFGGIVQAEVRVFHRQCQTPPARRRMNSPCFLMENLSRGVRLWPVCSLPRHTRILPFERLSMQPAPRGHSILACSEDGRF